TPWQTWQHAITLCVPKSAFAQVCACSKVGCTSECRSWNSSTPQHALSLSCLLALHPISQIFPPQHSGKILQLLVALQGNGYPRIIASAAKSIVHDVVLGSVTLRQWWRTTLRLQQRVRQRP